MTAQPRFKVRHLPIVFRSLDLEEKTKPVPSLVCPVRADLMTVGNCGRCADFREIAFDENGQPELCCSSERGFEARDERVQEFVRVPVVCTAPDTTLAVVLPYLGLGLPARDAIPVLDVEACPIGFVTIGEARRLVASSISLETTLAEVMSRQIVSVLPETPVAEAKTLLEQTGSSRLFAVAADGSFLGLVDGLMLA